MASILLKGGTVLYHEDNHSVSALRNTDVLITGSIISQIGTSISVADPDNVRVIDCRDKIICPGFIDTHHHPWQTQMKGIHSDHTLVDYIAPGNLQSFNYKANDVFWGELAGLMEAVDGGTTTIVDHSHVTRSEDFAFAALAATIASGIRSMYCMSLVPEIARWDHQVFEAASEPVPSWFFETLAKLREAVDGEKNELVSLGLAFDSYHMPSADIKEFFDRAEGIGVDLITSHWRRLDAKACISVPDVLHGIHLLESRKILLSHGNGSTEAELKVLKDAGCYIASTPPTESQMGHGEPIAGPDAVGSTTPLVSLGVDCNSNNCSSMLHAMHLYLAVARSHRNSHALSQGQFPRDVQPRTEEVFNMATIDGARAIGMEDKIGSLRPGKQADIVIFDAASPAMVPASDVNPLVAVVRHASPAEIGMVIIAGEIKKEGGAVLPAVLKKLGGWNGFEEIKRCSSHGALTWPVVREQLRNSRDDIFERAKSCNMDVATRGVIGAFGLSKDQIDRLMLSMLHQEAMVVPSVVESSLESTPCTLIQ